MGSDVTIPPAGNTSAGPNRALKYSLYLLVILLAVFQFSENTVDPDLWGHVIFGQEILHSRAVPATEIYSWTAHDQPWLNHELAAELSLGMTHSLLGGTGLLALKIGIGLLTFLLCLRLAIEDLSGPARLWAWAFGALAVVEISYGFAARPQIFTALFLAAELLLLRRIHAGRLSWAFYLPILFLIWINTHGGALIGFALLNLAALATIAHFVVRQTRGELSPDEIQRQRKLGLFLWLALITSAGTLLCNPWRTVLLQWLIHSILWLRPQIEEWNATPFGWDHAAFFFVLALTTFAWLFTRRRRVWWEVAVTVAVAVIAVRSVRNTPLFGIVALALVPAHLADALERFQTFFIRLTALAQRACFQKIIAAILAVASVGIGIGIFTLHKEHPLTMEVPRSKYPVGAVAFMREHQLTGNTLTFFDWGEMVIFELPGCLPSIDGRLDTCYSHELIAAHWQFYNNQPFDKAVLNPDHADLALLPTKLAGALALKQQAGWQAAYFDEVAVVLVRDVARFPGLNPRGLPVEGAKTNTMGRAVFADRSPRWMKQP